MNKSSGSEANKNLNSQETSPLNLMNLVNDQLQQLQMLMHRSMFSRLGSPFSPSRGQGRILAILKMKPEISQKELTYLLNMSKQAVAELMSKLEKNGLITRTPADQDRRIMTVCLTEEGQAAAEQVTDRLKDNAQALDCLTEAELTTFSQYLDRLIKQYETLFPEADFEERRQEMAQFMMEHRLGHGPGFGPGHGPGMDPDFAPGMGGPGCGRPGHGPGCGHGPGHDFAHGEGHGCGHGHGHSHGQDPACGHAHGPGQGHSCGRGHHHEQGADHAHEQTEPSEKPAVSNDNSNYPTD